MPARDGTGPMGKGSKTGRGLGNCDQNNSNKSKPSTQRRGPAGDSERLMWDSTLGRLLGRKQTDSTKPK